MSDDSYIIKPIGIIRSELKNISDAPKQGDEGGYETWLEIKPQFAAGLRDIQVGDDLIVLTWLHLSKRDVVEVHPRGNPDKLLTGVFVTRSPNRPNPIGLHPVTVLQIADNALKIAPVEAVDGTPVIDIKSVIKAGKPR